MRLLLHLLLNIGIALACVDVFFVLEGPKHKDHAIRVAKTIHLAKEDREAFVLIQKKRELAVKKVVNDHSLRSSIELIRLAQPLSSTIETVVEQISERKTDRPLVVLVFTEKDLDKKQLEKFQFSSKYHKLYVFLMRTDHLKRNKSDPLEFAAEDVLGNGNNSLEEILQCSKKTENKTASYKSTTASLGKETTTTTATTRKKTFSKTTRVARSTTPRNSSSTTRRPVIFNRRSNSIDQNSLSVNENFFASSPSTTTRHIRTTKRATTTAQKFTQKRANRFGSRVSDSPSTRRTVTSIATTTPTTRATTKPPPGCQADVLFLMDFSRGAEEKLEHYLRIAESIVSTLPIDENLVRVGMIKFSGPGRQESLFSLKSHKTSEGVIGAIRKAADSQRGGTTRTGEALLYAEKDFHKFKGGRESVTKHIVLFTDGWSQEDPTAAAHELRRSGVSVYVIGVKDLHLPPNLEEMKEIAGDANNVFIEPEGRQIRGKIVGSCRI